MRRCHGSWEEAPPTPGGDRALLEMLLVQCVCRQGQTEQKEGQQRGSGGSEEPESVFHWEQLCVFWSLRHTILASCKTVFLKSIDKQTRTVFELMTMDVAEFDF